MQSILLPFFNPHKRTLNLQYSMEEMFSFLVFSAATCRRVQVRGRMEERKGGRAPLGVKDKRRDGAAP